MATIWINDSDLYLRFSLHAPNNTVIIKGSIASQMSGSILAKNLIILGKLEISGQLTLKITGQIINLGGVYSSNHTNFPEDYLTDESTITKLNQIGVQVFRHKKNGFSLMFPPRAIQDLTLQDPYPFRSSNEEKIRRDAFPIM